MHPAIERTIRTGYPHDEQVEVICEHCGDELNEHLEFDEMAFCGTDCLGKWMVDNDYAKRIA